MSEFLLFGMEPLEMVVLLEAAHVWADPSTDLAVSILLGKLINSSFGCENTQVHSPIWLIHMPLVCTYNDVWLSLYVLHREWISLMKRWDLVMPFSFWDEIASCLIMSSYCLQNSSCCIFIIILWCRDGKGLLDNLLFKFHVLCSWLLEDYDFLQFSHIICVLGFFALFFTLLM